MRCHDCGWKIHPGTVAHVCPSPPVVEDMLSHVTVVTFGPYDGIVRNRKTLGDEQDAS